MVIPMHRHWHLYGHGERVKSRYLWSYEDMWNAGVGRDSKIKRMQTFYLTMDVIATALSEGRYE